jgi:hypothetical protein
VLLHRLLHFSDDVLLVLGDGVADGGVNVVGGEDRAVHESAVKVGVRGVYALLMTAIGTAIADTRL